MKISVSKTLNALVAGSFFWVVGCRPGSVFFVVLFIVGSVWLVCRLVRLVEVVQGFYQVPWRAFGACQVLVVGFELSCGGLPVVARSSLAVVVAMGGGIDDFLGIFCHSFGLGMIVRYLGFLKLSHVGPRVWLAYAVL